MAIREPVEISDSGPSATGSVRPKPGGSASNLRVIAALAVCGILGYLAFAFFPMPGNLRAPQEGPTTVALAPSRTPAQTPLPTPSSQPTPLTAAPAGPPAAPPQRLVYPAAEIDVAVLPLDLESAAGGDRTIVPPATMDGYWLTPFGMPGADSTNTTYIVGHSWQDLEAPFNRLSTHAAAGDRLTVATSAGATEYQVDFVTTYVKSGLKDSPVWEVAPQRLVLISCYTDDLWGTNVVVVASPVA